MSARRALERLPQTEQPAAADRRRTADGVQDGSTDAALSKPAEPCSCHHRRVPDDREADVAHLPPLVRPPRPAPVPVVVSLDGEAHPGLVTAWRGENVLVEYTTLGLKYNRWLPADRVTRVDSFVQDVENEPADS